MGTKNNPASYDCYEAADPDEPMFVLLARDPQAPALVEMWAAIRECAPGANLEKVAEARRCARAMEAWREAQRLRTYGHTKSGTPITDDLIEGLAAEAEAGYDVDQLIARRGKRERPTRREAQLPREPPQLDV